MYFVKLQLTTMPRVMYANAFESKNILNKARNNSYFEMTYIEKEYIDVKMDNYFNIRLYEGSFCLFPPNQRYSVSYKSKKPHKSINIAFFIDNNLCEICHEDDIIFDRYDKSLLVKNECIYLPLYDNKAFNENFLILMKKIVIYNNSTEEYINFKSSALLINVLMSIAVNSLSKLNLQKEESHPSNEIYCRKIDDYLRQNYKEQISMQDIAQFIGLHPNYICNIYKKTRDITVMEKLLKIRLEKAKILLEQKKFKVKDISEMVGFLNHKYFNIIFKKYESVSPGKYNAFVLKKDEEKE